MTTKPAKHCQHTIKGPCISCDNPPTKRTGKHVKDQYCAGPNCDCGYPLTKTGGNKNENQNSTNQ